MRLRMRVPARETRTQIKFAAIAAFRARRAPYSVICSQSGVPAAEEAALRWIQDGDRDVAAWEDLMDQGEVVRRSLMVKRAETPSL